MVRQPFHGSYINTEGIEVKEGWYNRVVFHFFVFRILSVPATPCFTIGRQGSVVNFFLMSVTESGVIYLSYVSQTLI